MDNEELKGKCFDTALMIWNDLATLHGFDELFAEIDESTTKELLDRIAIWIDVGMKLGIDW